MSELSPRVKYAQWFFSGLAVGALGLMLVVNPMFKSTFKSVETIQSVDQRRIASQQSAITQLQGEAKELIAQRDTCTAKFQRATILYDVGMFNNETRAWLIPVDVTPIAAPDKRGSFSHYDSKTQTETVHFQAKTQ